MGFKVSDAEYADWQRKGLVPAEPAPAPVVERISEKAFQAAVIALAKRNGFLVYHTFNSKKSEAGFPDLVLIRAGSLIIAELKVGDNKPTVPQSTWLEAFRECGVPAFVWYPKDLETIVTMLEGNA